MYRRIQYWLHHELDIALGAFQDVNCRLDNRHVAWVSTEGLGGRRDGEFERWEGHLQVARSSAIDVVERGVLDHRRCAIDERAPTEEC